jgi:hypothetical protein
VQRPYIPPEPGDWQEPPTFGRPEYYDRDGEPITLWEYIHLVGNAAYKIVRQTTIGDAQVSTVWLGIDHRFSLDPDVSPLIFETMIFSTKTSYMKWPGSDREMAYHEADDLQERYTTEQQALERHAEIVDMLSSLQQAPQASDVKDPT